MKSDFFYSESTGLYIARKPLKIDARTKEAAQRSGIKVDWNDEGSINGIDYDDGKKLIKSLGGKMLTPEEYWKVFRDAISTGDSDMMGELTSDKYSEWLDRVYIGSDRFIDSPKIEGKYQYSGNLKISRCPDGRPGWFNPEDNIGETAEPINVLESRDKFSTTWKFWSPDLSVTSIGICAPIRGYVTSVGKPSYDLGIPVDSRQPRLMIRECRYNPPAPLIEEEIVKKAESLQGIELLKFLYKFGSRFSGSKDSLIHRLSENLFDRLGDLAFDLDVTDAAEQISRIEYQQLDYSSFERFVRESKKSLEQSILENKDIVFVMGHKNPDTDTAISCLFEAYRNQIMDPNTAYIPVIQASRVPDEVSHLLEGLAESFLLSNNQSYHQARTSGLARWISVDQNREPEVQKYFISIIDHHIPCEAAKSRDIPKTLEMLGSTAALVTRKYLGMGLRFDQKMAKILYGASLMDTENRVSHKMTLKDRKIMDYLKDISGIENDDEFYGSLMSKLLNTDDADILFKRDYKEDWGFGFAVAKIKNGFSKTGELKKQDLVRRLYEIANANNHEKNLPFTLLKVTDYEEDNETVNRERIYYVFNSDNPKFQDAIKTTLESIIRFEFPSESIEKGKDHIDFWGSGLQLSRKKTAPVIEPICSAFNRYFYSPAIDRWVKRDFLRKTASIKGDYSTDSEGRINYITQEEAIDLARVQGFSLLSLTEYWKVLSDAKNSKDFQMIESLQGSNFVEFFDSQIIDSEFLVEHGGEKRRVSVPKGNPGLIHPDEIDPNSGLPKIVRSPNEYGNPDLWRYWQPDREVVIPCRSFIFLLDQPCLDGKFHPGESFPNLGIRPVVEKVEDPDVNITWDSDDLSVKIHEEGETHDFIWPKKLI